MYNQHFQKVSSPANGRGSVRTNWLKGKKGQNQNGEGREGRIETYREYRGSKGNLPTRAWAQTSSSSMCTFSGRPLSHSFSNLGRADGRDEINLRVAFPKASINSGSGLAECRNFHITAIQTSSFSQSLAFSSDLIMSTSSGITHPHHGLVSNSSPSKRH